MTTNCSHGRRARRRAVGVAAAAVALALASVGSAWADPTPVTGPAAGGTVVTVSPASATVPVTATAVSAANAHTVAVCSDGRLCDWGRASLGELGNGTPTGVATQPTAGTVPLPAGVTVTKIGSGGNHTDFIGSDGKLYSWGVYGTSNASLPTLYTPTAIALPGGAVPADVAAGGLHSLGVTTTGALYAWGNSGYGQIGNGSSGTAYSPVVLSVPGVTFAKVAAGGFHSLALTTTGQVYAWGKGGEGELGLGGTGDQNTPQLVPLPAGVTITAVAANNYASLALASNGTLYAWGDNSSGQMCDGTTTNRTSPIAVPLPAGVTVASMTEGLAFTAVLSTTGKVYSCGDNWAGQLGNGTTTSSTSLALASMPETITQIDAGLWSLEALGASGTVYGVGYNSFGNLGDGTTTNTVVPVAAVSSTAVTSVTFDGVAGTNLTDNGDGTWSVTAPAHAAGTVTMAVTSGCVCPDACSAKTVDYSYTYTTPPVITTTSLAGGTVNDAYSQPVSATGTAPVSFTVSSGTLPAGLTLTAAGVLSGTPTVAGTYTFVVTAQNSVGSDTHTYTVIVDPAAAPSASASPSSSSASSLATVTGSVSIVTGVPGTGASTSWGLVAAGAVVLGGGVTVLMTSRPRRRDHR